MKNNKSKIIMLLTLVLTLLLQTTMAFIITEPQTMKNTFKPFKFPSNDLLVSKVVEHPFGESYQIPENIIFDFDIDFGEGYANYTFVTSQGEKQTNEQGIMRVQLKPNEKIHIEEVDEGTKVTVTEIQNKPGFTIKDVAVTKDGTISSKETLIVDYTNVYKPLAVIPDNVTLTGTKILEGREWQAGDTFSFTLEYQTDTGEWIALDTKTITYNQDNTEYNKFDFTETLKMLEFNRLGTHNFRISEIIGELENIDYDKTINYFNIEVTDETMDGQLEINKINGYQNITVTENTEEKNYNINVIFNNTYELKEIKDLNIKANGIVKIDNTGEKELGPENFEITMTNTKTEEVIKLNTDQNGQVSFDLKYTKEDIGKTFEYIIKQTNSAKEGVTYSDKEYKVNITITLNDKNELVAKILVNGIEVDEILAEFINTYNVDPPIEPPEDITLDVNINKAIKNVGDVKIGPEGFEFVLENTTTKKQYKVKTDSNGKANIKLNYTSEDIDKTYNYTLKEIDTKLPNVTYDKDIYKIDVTIKLSDDNKLVATTKINGKKVNGINTIFENTYEKYIINDLMVNIGIKNNVNNTGKYSIGPENFEFILVNTENGKEEKTTSDKNGNANIGLTFTENDIGKTYKYKLSLVEGNIKGLTYSKETYDIEITITLNDSHQLVATIKLNGKVLNGPLIANFVNIYHVVPEVPSSPPTIDITDNTPYIKMMIISGGGLLLILLLQNTKEQKYCFATATYIAELLEPVKKEKVKKRNSSNKKSKYSKYSKQSNEELYNNKKKKKYNKKSYKSKKALMK